MWLLKCRKAHEQQHMDDFNAGKFPQINPSSCVGQPNNATVTVPTAYKPNVECPAYQKQLQCLSPMESLMSSEISFVKGQLKKYNCPNCGSNQ